MRIHVILLFSVLAVCVAQADDSGWGFTFDLNQPAQSQTLPSWIDGQPSASPSAHASISFPIAPPPDEADLAATFYFTETAGGFLRVYWQGTQTSEMLSENLFEGIAMPNQRTVLIKRSTLTSSGSLTVQSSGSTLNVSRIHFEWVEPTDVSLADGAAQSALINATGGILKDTEVNGAPLLPQQDQIQNSVVTASITEKPVRIESGVEFSATLQAMPLYARLTVQVSGAPVGIPVQLTVNGNPTETISIYVPDLNDPGYVVASGSSGLAAPVYIGWLKGVVYVPVKQLKVGENAFQIGLQGIVPSGTASPLAVKDLLLQLKYPDPASAAQPVNQPTPADVPAVPTISGT